MGEEVASKGLTGSQARRSAFLSPLHAHHVPGQSGRTGDIGGGEVPNVHGFRAHPSEPHVCPLRNGTVAAGPGGVTESRWAKP